MIIAAQVEGTAGRVISISYTEIRGDVSARLAPGVKKILQTRLPAGRSVFRGLHELRNRLLSARRGSTVILNLLTSCLKRFLMNARYCCSTACVLMLSAFVAETVRGEVLLTFNGKDLRGFYTFVDNQRNSAQQKVFEVTEEGWLRIRGNPRGYLSTEKSLTNYRLRAEFKWGSDDLASDSGIFFHAVPEDRLWSKSLEVQMRAGATGDLCLIGQGSTLTAKGKKWSKGCIPRPGKGDPQAELEVQRGQWNQVDLTCRGDSVRLAINGKLVLEGTAAAPNSGRIYFQSFKGELFYRKIEFHSLAD